MFSSLFMGDSNVFDEYLKDISSLFLSVLSLNCLKGVLFTRQSLQLSEHNEGLFSLDDCATLRLFSFVK